MKDINRDRHCTDLICLIIFCVFVASVVIIGIVGAVSGNAESLFYDGDSWFVLEVGRVFIVKYLNYGWFGSPHHIWGKFVHF